MSAAQGKNDPLAKIRDTFLRLTSPREFSGQEKKRTGSVTVMNVPVFLACADAGAELVLELLRQDSIVQQPDAVRAAFYTRCRRIADDAWNNAANAAAELPNDKKDLPAFMELMAFLVQYLDILIALAGLQDRAAARDGYRFLADTVQRQDLLCSSGELTVLPFLQETVHAHAGAFTKIREQIRKGLSRTDLQRYNKARSAFLAANREQEAAQ